MNHTSINLREAIAKRTKEAYLRFSRSVQTWSHWAGSPETWSELKRAATTAGILVRCLRSQSLFRIPAIGWGGAEASFEGLAIIEIFEKSGNARAFIGGCSEWRWEVIVAWSSGQPTRDTNATGGVRSSSGYSSIGFCDALILMPRECTVVDNGEELRKLLSELIFWFVDEILGRDGEFLDRVWGLGWVWLALISVGSWGLGKDDLDVGFLTWTGPCKDRPVQWVDLHK